MIWGDINMNMKTNLLPEEYIAVLWRKSFATFETATGQH